MATFTPIGAGQSSRHPIGFKHPNSRVTQFGEPLFDDNFNDGSFCGWKDHYGFDVVKGNVGVSSRFPLHGTHALTIGPHNGTLVTATQFRGNGAYRRVTAPGPPTTVSLAMWIALTGQGDLHERKWPFERAWVGIDHQLQDNSARYFAQFILMDQNDGSLAWYLRTGKTGSAATGTWRTPEVVKIPGSDMQFAGLNEGKTNYFLVRPTLSYDKALAGGSLFEEVQIGNQVYDIRGLAPNPFDLLLNNGSWDMFTSGLNAGAGIVRSTNNPDYRNTRMYVGRATMTYGDRIKG